METTHHHWELREMLAWQVELGATEAILDAPVNRYEAPAAAPKAVVQAAPTAPIELPKVDPVAVATSAAEGAQDLASLQGALAAFEHCELKRGARNLVFADGQPAARLMIIGEAPDREEDREGRPFVGRMGQLLDKMLAAIDMARDAEDVAKAAYITNVVPWRPPQNRDPNAQEMAMMRPFVERHIELANPDMIVLMGNIPCQTLLGARGITRLRGTWRDFMDRPCLPMFHPSDLLRKPIAKREAWHDLLMVQAKLRGAV